MNHTTTNALEVENKRSDLPRGFQMYRKTLAATLAAFPDFRCDSSVLPLSVNTVHFTCRPTADGVYFSALLCTIRFLNFSFRLPTPLR